MRTLVTGAAGFIGSHLAATLAARGDSVTGLDDFNAYYDPAKKRHNAARLAAAGIDTVEADIRDRTAMLALFEEGRFEAVAHIAAMAGVRNSVAHPNLYIDVNLNGTQNLLDAARTVGGVENFVMASTSSIYGDTTTIPFVETDACVRPPQPYAAAKRAAELLGFTYHALYGLNFTATRFFTVYGPYGRPDMMPYLLAESISKGVEIPLYEGDMRRDWTYVDDIVAGVVAAVDRPLGFEIVNLGRGQPEPLTDFIRELEGVAGRRANLRPTPRLDADMLITYADISKARRLLGFEPTVSMADGVRRFWAWYSQRDAVLAAPR